MHPLLEKMKERSSQRKSPCLVQSLFVSLLLILVRDVYAMELGDNCTNPLGVQGTCIGFEDCAPILSVLQAKPISLPISKETEEFVRRSHCGFKGRNSLFCCPSDNKTPNVTALGPLVTEDVSQHPNLGLLRNDICGPEYENQIFIGSDVHLGELPWMALLEYSVGKASPFMCGGSIINDRYVLTAAHCVMALPRNSSVIAVRLGEHNLTSPIDCEEDTLYGAQSCSPPPQNISIEKVIRHPTYIGWPDVHYDIALIRLSRPANFTDEAVRPICLPIGLAQQNKDLVGKNVEVSGWGSSLSSPPSPLPRKWKVPVISHSQCADEFKDVVPISAVSQICAEDARGTSMCSVDSGGPLTHKETVLGQRRIVQHGILSYGPRNCGSPFEPGVYTRVGHYMKWILDNIEP